MASRASVLEQIKSLSGVVIIVLTILGSALFGMSRYNDLDNDLTKHEDDQQREELQTEHRLTVIEQEIRHINENLERSNRLLERILEELK